MAALTAQELARLVPCPVEDVHRLADLGVLAHSGAGDGFAPADAHLVRLMAAFEGAGIAVEDVARGLATGELSFPLGLFLPEPSGSSATYEELAHELGRPPELVRRLASELGLPPPDDDLVRGEDAELLTLLLTKLDLVTEDDLSRLARLYGSGVQRLVAGGLQFFDRAVRQRVFALDLSNEEKDKLVYQSAGGFTEVVQALVPWLQRRHREHAVFEYLVSVTEGFMEERGIAPRPARKPPAIAFLDLTGYTELADEHGDEAAADLAADLADVVQAATRVRGCRPVKWLGDGVMFHFDEAGAAVLVGLELVEETERAVSVPARVGIHAGPVVVQDGDYFGRTVNTAARIADYARPSEVLVSEEARRESSGDDIGFEPVGDVPLKGISATVRLHRALRTRAHVADEVQAGKP